MKWDNRRELMGVSNGTVSKWRVFTIFLKDNRLMCSRKNTE